MNGKSLDGSLSLDAVDTSIKQPMVRHARYEVRQPLPQTDNSIPLVGDEQVILNPAIM